MARNKSEKELEAASEWVRSENIPLDKWMHVAITYNNNTDRSMQFNIPTERGLEIYQVGDDGKLKLLRIIKGGMM